MHWFQCKPVFLALRVLTSVSQDLRRVGSETKKVCEFVPRFSRKKSSESYRGFFCFLYYPDGIQIFLFWFLSDSEENLWRIFVPSHQSSYFHRGMNSSNVPSFVLEINHKIFSYISSYGIQHNLERNTQEFFFLVLSLSLSLYHSLTIFRCLN